MDCHACRTNRSLAYFLVSSARQWLARRFLGRIAYRFSSSFLPLISGSLDGSSDGSLIGLLPRFFRSSVARRTDRSSAYFLVPSARQWLAVRITRRLTSSFLPLVSGSPDGLVIDLLPPSFRSSVACLACRIECSSAYFLVPSACQLLARLARRIAHRLTSSFLPPISVLPGSPDGALIGLLPRSFCSSVACPTACRTDRLSAYFLVPSAPQSLTRRIARRLTSLFLPLINGLHDGLPDGSLFGLLPRSFRSSVACPTACRVDRSSASFLVPSARQWLARLAGRIAHRLTSSFPPLVCGLPDGSVIGLLPRSFRSSVA